MPWGWAPTASGGMPGGQGPAAMSKQRGASARRCRSRTRRQRGSETGRSVVVELSAPPPVTAVPVVAVAGLVGTVGVAGLESAPGDRQRGAAAAAGGQRALVSDRGLREVLRLAGDVDGEGEVLAGELAAALVVVLLVRVLARGRRHVRCRGCARERWRRRVGGHVGRVGRVSGAVGGGEIGRVGGVPRRQ